MLAKLCSPSPSSGTLNSSSVHTVDYGVTNNLRLTNKRQHSNQATANQISDTALCSPQRSKLPSAHFIKLKVLYTLLSLFHAEAFPPSLPIYLTSLSLYNYALALNLRLPPSPLHPCATRAPPWRRHSTDSPPNSHSGGETALPGTATTTPDALQRTRRLTAETTCRLTAVPPCRTHNLHSFETISTAKRYSHTLTHPYIPNQDSLLLSGHQTYPTLSYKVAIQNFTQRPHYITSHKFSTKHTQHQITRTGYGPKWLAEYRS